jgi:hypothetical protein
MSYKFPEFKSGNKSFAAALNAIVAAARRHGVNPGGRPGWVETDKGWMPPYILAGEGSGIDAWDLVPFEEQYKIANPGRIYLDYNDLAQPVTITGITSAFDFGPSKYAYIKLTNLAEPTFELVFGPAPQTPFKTYKFASGETFQKVEEAYFLLWEGIAGTLPEGEWGKQFEDFYARRVPRPVDLVLQWGGYESDEAFTHVIVPILSAP